MTAPLIPLPPSLGQHSFGADPELTKLFATLMYELRGDVDKYMFRVDRVFNNVDQANERLRFLGRCNASIYFPETKLAGIDAFTYGEWLTYTKSGSQQPRFFIEVKEFTMLGPVCAASPAKTHTNLVPQVRSQRFDKLSKDKANHVWLVYVNQPEVIFTTTSTGKPKSMSWYLESVHAASATALSHAKNLWKTKMFPTHGKCVQIAMHHGFATWAFIRLEDRMSASYDMITQVRVERIAITPPGEQVSLFSPAEALLYDKPFRPLCRGRNRAEVGTFSTLSSDIGDVAQAGDGEEDEIEEEWEARMTSFESQRSSEATLVGSAESGNHYSDGWTESRQLYHILSRESS